MPQRRRPARRRSASQASGGRDRGTPRSRATTRLPRPIPAPRPSAILLDLGPEAELSQCRRLVRKGEHADHDTVLERPDLSEARAAHFRAAALPDAPGRGHHEYAALAGIHGLLDFESEVLELVAPGH